MWLATNCYVGLFVTYIQWQYPPANPTISASFNHSWLVIQVVVFLISGQGYFPFLYRYTNHNREGGRKEQTDLGQLQAQERVGLWHFLSILGANVSVYTSENSHKATSNADLSSLPYFHLCRQSSSALLCRLVSSAFRVLPLNDFSCRLSLRHTFPRPSSLVGDLGHWHFVWVSRQNKGILWLAPTHRETYATHSVTIQS